MMVMVHNGERRCPFCMSKQLKVVDYDVAKPEFAHKGKFWFSLKCKKCFGSCEDINNLDLAEKRAKRKLEAMGVAT